MKIDPAIVEMMKKFPSESLLKDIVGVQPMPAAAGLIFTLKAPAWSLPNERFCLRSDDDITVLLTMGYRLAHDHNCCTSFGNRYREPIPFWINPDEEDYNLKSCEHTWEEIAYG